MLRRFYIFALALGKSVVPHGLSDRYYKSFCVCTDLPLAHVVGVFAINWIKLNGLDGIRVLYFLAHVMM